MILCLLAVDCCMEQQDFEEEDEGVRVLVTLLEEHGPVLTLDAATQRYAFPAAAFSCRERAVRKGKGRGGLDLDTLLRLFRDAVQVEKCVCCLPAPSFQRGLTTPYRKL